MEGIQHHTFHLRSLIVFWKRHAKMYRILNNNWIMAVSASPQVSAYLGTATQVNVMVKMWVWLAKVIRIVILVSHALMKLIIPIELLVRIWKTKMRTATPTMSVQWTKFAGETLPIRLIYSENVKHYIALKTLKFSDIPSIQALILEVSLSMREEFAKAALLYWLIKLSPSVLCSET